MNEKWLTELELNFDTHQHPYADQYDLPVSYELTFPIGIGGKKSFQVKFGNAFAEYVSIDGREAQRLFNQSYSAASSSKLKGLFKELLEVYLPKSLVIADEDIWIRCVSEESPTRECSHLFLKPFCPPEKSNEESVFLAMFGDILEGFPNEGGRFFSKKSDPCPVPPIVSEMEDWNESFVAFASSTGDLLLLNGHRIGWFVLSKGRVAECKFGLFDFGTEFIRHKLDTGWQSKTSKQICMPFDTYNSSFGLAVLESIGDQE